MQDKAGEKKRLVFANALVKTEQTKGSLPNRPLLPPMPPNTSED